MKKWQVSDILYPALFGIGVLVFWQAVVKGFNVPAVLLPAPYDIGAKFMSSLRRPSSSCGSASTGTPRRRWWW